MEQWQYEKFSVPYNGKDGSDIVKLNELGSQGWELVSVIQWGDRDRTIFYLKRRVPDATAYRG